MDNYFVYKFMNHDKEVVYVGKTKQPLERRIALHFGNTGHLSKEQLETVESIEYLELGSRVEMDIAELYYINKWKPEFNTQSKYDEDFLLEGRENDIWNVFDFEIQDKDPDGSSSTTKLRVEIVLTDVDSDIIEQLEATDIPRATQFKLAMRASMKEKDEEDMDGRVRRLIADAISITGSKNVDYKEAFEMERLEKEQIKGELESLRESIRKLIA